MKVMRKKKDGGSGEVCREGKSSSSVGITIALYTRASSEPGEKRKKEKKKKG